MTRRHIIAIAVSVACMLVAFIPPLWLRSTGTEVALELRPVDPQSLFRGNYVDLDYDVPIPDATRLEWEDTVYAVFDNQRPANVVRVTTDRPNLEPGQTCLRGDAWGERIRFPQFEQYFVTPEDGLRLERSLGQMVGIIKATDSCRGILVSIEPR